MPSLEKSDAMVKFNRVQTVKKLMACFIIAMMCFAVVNFQALVDSLGCVFVSHENWSWFSNSRFLILLLNITIVTLTTKSRLLTAQPNRGTELHDLYDELVKRNKMRSRFSSNVENKSSLEKDRERKGSFIVHDTRRIAFGSTTDVFCSDKRVENSSREPVTDEPMEDCHCAENIPAAELIFSESTVIMTVEIPVMEEETCNTIDMTDKEFQRRSDDFIAKIRSQIRKGM